MKPSAVICLFAMIGVSLSIAHAQNVDEFGKLSIRTDVESALVLVDGVLVGRTPFVADSLPAGVHAVRVLHPDLENWGSTTIDDSVRIDAGGEVQLEYHLATSFLIRSEPSGAEVYNRGKLLGTTPLLVDDVSRDSEFRVKLREFADTVLKANTEERGVLSATLQRIPNTGNGPETSVRESGGPQTLPLVLTGTSSIIAGGFSAYFKVKADGLYSEYLATGDPSKRGEARRLDSIAGISLAASQIYLALFIYLLVSP